MSKRFFIPGIFFGSLCIFLMIGCEKKVAKLASSAPPPGACDTITYSKQIKTIIDAKCGTGAGCHAGGSPSGNVSLTNYTQVKDRADAGRINQRVFVEGTMPMSPVTLTQQEKDLLRCWLDNGTKE